MKEIIKNQKNLLILSIAFCLWEASIINGDIRQNREVSLSSENSIHRPEHEVLAMGVASYGDNTITGKACIIMKRKELKKICEGDIVIAPAIHSTWYSELSLAAAIITEKGDDSSHARAYGKKLNIPIIVGVDDATKKIMDGQTIICDPIAKTIYHVAYPAQVSRVRFDTLLISPKENIHPNIPRGRKAKTINYSKIKNDRNDGFIPSVTTMQEDNICIIQNESEYKKGGITKDIYCFDLPSFKKYVFDMKFWLNGVRAIPFFADKALESGAKRNGCDSFAIDCIPLSFHLFDQSDSYINTILQSAVEYIDYASPMLHECNQKPGDLNWVARVCHKTHIEAISSDLPSGTTKEELIADPKKYRNVDKKMNTADREKFTKKRDLLTALGLYIRFCVEGKKLSR